MYESGNMVRIRYQDYRAGAAGDLTVPAGETSEIATVTRVWGRAPYVTLRTASGKTFTRDAGSPSITPATKEDA